MHRLLSTTTPEGSIQFSVEQLPSPLEEDLKPTEVVVRVEAAPINPSDLGVMLGSLGSKISLVSEEKGSDGKSILVLTGAEKSKEDMKKRAGRKVFCGNEGAGTVVKAGEQVKEYLGKVVALFGGEMYATYKKVNVSSMPLIITHHDGTTPAEAAGSFVNPLTVLCMIHTARKEGHSAIIHTAAASALGIMLQKICLEENFPLINIVRKQEQEDILRGLGAKYVIRQDKASFMEDLTAVILATKATVAFDAVGGGPLADQILKAMETAAIEYIKPALPGPYGTSVNKKVYIYGALDAGNTILSRPYGYNWSVSGFLVTNVMGTLSQDEIGTMYRRIADGIKTTFATKFGKEISLNEAIKKDSFLEYSGTHTSNKFMINPLK